MSEHRYTTFREFWPFYLSQHSNIWTRRLHVFGVLMAVTILIFAVVEHKPLLIIAAIVAGYFPAWVGHFFIEKNRPATFQYPLFSFMGDMKMFWQIITRKEKREPFRGSRLK